MRLLALVAALILSGAAFWFWRNAPQEVLESPQLKQNEEQARPLDKYTFDSLAKVNFAASEVILGEVLADYEDFTSYKFYFYVDGNPSTGSGFKKVSGLLNVPRAFGTYPVIVMFRGYVDREAYTTGVGTQKAGEVFAKSNFITLAPDFLGYGQSDNPSEDPMEERFQTYVVALTLLESVKKLNDTFCHSEFSSESNKMPKQVQHDEECVGDIIARVDPSKIGIWGHSNGSQIALSVLEITGRSYPTVLWAPVGKPFPYSILYYTDEFDDHGKMLRKVIAEFEKDYDVELYNLTNYFGQINAPLQVHQGTADDSVPQKWSDQLVSELAKLEKDVDYFTYMGADHNLAPNGWGLAVSRSLSFYGKNLGI